MSIFLRCLPHQQKILEAFAYNNLQKVLGSKYKIEKKKKKKSFC